MLATLVASLGDIAQSGAASGFDWRMMAMWVVSGALLAMALGCGVEPLLLVPVAFGALLANLPGHSPFFSLLGGGRAVEILVPLIFLGVGMLTDFGPLIANPLTFLLGGAAQVGVLVGFLGGTLFGFSPGQAAAAGIVSGSDGATAIFLGGRLVPDLVGSLAVAACVCMAMLPVLQPPIMRLLTTERERRIRMRPCRVVSRVEKLSFAGMTTVVCGLALPSIGPVIGMLMLGNFLRECGLIARITRESRNGILDAVIILLGLVVGLGMTAGRFLRWETIGIILFGVLASAFSTACGVLMARLLNRFVGEERFNPLIGGAGLCALGIAARVADVEGERADPGNDLLPHAMGSSLAGLIATVLLAGYFIGRLG